MMLDRVQFPVPVHFTPFSGIYAYFFIKFHIGVLQFYMLPLLRYDCDVILINSAITDSEN